MTVSIGTPSLTEVERRRFGRRAQLLAATSVGYNVVEAVVAITAGMVAGSIALVGFGLDSIVEVSSGLIILWQFRHPLPESREKTALRLMAFSFFASPPTSRLNRSGRSPPGMKQSPRPSA